MAYERIAIIGKPGAGKTTLGRRLSQILNIKHIELDGIHWQPDWTKPEKSDFKQWVSDAAPADGQWIADGNYSAVREIVWGRATTAIWLDYPLWLALWRLLWRTLGRWVWQKELWNGNRENMWDHLTWDKNKNLFLFSIRMHAQHREQYPAVLREEYDHLNVLRFRHPKEVEEWLESLTKKEADKVVNAQH
jgi:adenylate kinase family enzyme